MTCGPDVCGVPSVLLAAAAALMWLLFLVRVIVDMAAHREKRPMYVTMPVVGLTAAVGSLGAAIAAAQSAGTVPTEIDPAFLALVAAMGRGALLMGAIVGLVYTGRRHGE